MGDVLVSVRANPVVRAVGPAACILVVQLVFFPVLDTPGIYIQGLVFGMLGALVAMGMALIYRANRILNFAQSDLGLAPTALAFNLMVYSGLNYLLALSIGILAALLLGSVIEIAIIRRFFKAPRLILTVATIGLSQALAVGSLLIPRIWGKEASTINFRLGAQSLFEVRPFTFYLDHMIALVVGPLAMIAVAVFLRRTNVGIAIRASAERSDRASLLGVPVKRLQTLVWAIGTLLSFIGVFLRASIVGLPLISEISYTGLLAALAALMLGGLTNLPRVCLSAIAIGVLEQAASWRFGEARELIDPVLAAVVVAALLFQRTGQARADHDTSSSWRNADEVRPIPLELRRVPEVVAVRWGLPLVGLVAVVALPQFLGAGNQGLAGTVGVFAIIGLSIIVLTGWAGQVSLGHMSLVAVGATVTAVAITQYHLELFLSLLAGGVVGSVVAIVIGLPALRLRGLFLAVTTLAFAVTCTSWLLSTKHFAWIPKNRFDRPKAFGVFDMSSERAYYYLCLGCFALAVLAVRGIRRSRTGRVLLAIRENERGAQAYGVNVLRAKLLAFAISGFLASFAGGLYVVGAQRYNALSFQPSESFNVFTSTVVGGLGSLSGGVVGAVYAQGGTWFLKPPWTLIPSAIGVLIVLMVLRGGLGGAIYQLRDMWLRSVARRRGIVVPSLLADVQTAEPEAHIPIVEVDVEELVDEAPSVFTGSAG